MSEPVTGRNHTIRVRDHGKMFDTDHVITVDDNLSQTDAGALRVDLARKDNNHVYVVESNGNGTYRVEKLRIIRD